MKTKATSYLLAMLAIGTIVASADPGPLAKYHNDIAAILTEERLRHVVDPGSEDVEVRIEKEGNSPNVTWLWPSDRVTVTDLGFTNIETPASNQLGVSQYRLLTDAEFGPKTGKGYIEANYRSIDAEEMAEIQQRMQAALQERVEKGELTAEQAAIAGGVGDSVAGNDRLVETIDGIGDACRWVPKGSTLVLGLGDVFIAIHSSISADEQENRAAAIRLAKLLAP